MQKNTPQFRNEIGVSFRSSMRMCCLDTLSECRSRSERITRAERATLPQSSVGPKSTFMRARNGSYWKKMTPLARLSFLTDRGASSRTVARDKMETEIACQGEGAETA